MKASLPFEEMLNILVDRHRRYLLECLEEEADPTIALDDATTYVTNQLTKKNCSPRQEEDVKTKLLHHHIPRLAESDLVEFDKRSETIRYYEHEKLEALHEHIKQF